MKVTISNFKEQEFQIELTYSHKKFGYGQWIISIDVMYEVDCFVYVNRFEEYTTNARMIDDITDLRSDDASHEDIQSRYHKSIFDSSVEEQITLWIDTLIIF